ncbi:MAG: CotH kinase family protein [Bacteroidota bacterium]|nr:CotH kinase family protein [Bacteroidota bacterium]
MKKKCLLFVFPLILLFSITVRGQIVINEISNANDLFLIDENDDAYDWIELFNSGTSSVNLLNYTITDNSSILDKWSFPEIIIEPQSYIIIFASAKDIKVGNALHTNFKIKATGEEIIISNDKGNIIDSYNFGELQNNHSFGRNPDGSETWCVFNNPSPGNTNNSSNCYEGYEPEPVFSLDAGFYSGNQTVELYMPSASGILKYSDDGSIPTESASLYSTSLSIDKTKVISARCFSSSNRLPSKTVKRTYFINETDLGLPVFSITIDPEDLWDYNKGMYVMGPGASIKFPYEGANFWKTWDKICYVEYFDKQNRKQFELEAELQIHGGRSRAFPQKSFRINPKKKKGHTPMEHPFFTEKPYIKSFNSINLRNGGQEYAASRIRDAFMHRILKNTHADILAYEPVILFLNGEYWGLYGLRERQDEHYIESNHKIDSKIVDIAKHRGTKIWAQSGSTDDFFEMHDIIKRTDPNDSDYLKIVSEKLDIENFTDYMLSQIYYGNDDWIDDTSPCNNIRFWRSQNGGKWRYAHFDLDKGLGGKRRLADVNNLAMVHNPIGPNIHSDMFKYLLKNQNFREYFINRYADIMNTIFQPKNMEMIAHEMRDEIDPFMHRHFEKWDGSYDKWLNEIDEMLEFNKQRLSIARMHIQKEFSLQKQVNVTLATMPLEAGRINISTIIPDSLPWTGVYFNGVPVTITAIANPGFTFDYWGVNNTISTADVNEAISLNISADDTFTAYFIGSATEPKITFSEINYHSAPWADAGDWIEVYNYGNTSVNLSGWFLSSDNNTNLYKIPIGTVIASKGYLVISSDVQKFVSQHPLVSNYIGQLPFNFNNNSEHIGFLDYNQKVISSLQYSDIHPWPIEADGIGKTLELKDSSVSLDLASNWFAGCPGGSPGKEYSRECITGIQEEVLNSSFKIEIGPNPSNDFIKIKVISKDDNFKDLTFQMYDFMGNEVKSIMPYNGNEIIISREEFAAGIYIVKIGSLEFYLTQKIILN